MAGASNKSVPPTVFIGGTGEPPQKPPADEIRKRAEETLSGYLRWAGEAAGRCAFRGHASAAWLLESSALRRLKEGQDVSKGLVGYLFTGYLDDIVNKIRVRFPEYDKLSDLEIMAHLQHQGGATGLIDFTESPLVALHFACQSVLEKGDSLSPSPSNGKVFAVRLDGKGISEVRKKETLQKSVDQFFPANPGKLWFWRPGHDDRRMVFQQSVFVFGHPAIDGHRDGVDFFEIPQIEKSALLGLLETMGVSERTLFSDFAGFADANAHTEKYPARSAEVYYTENIEREPKMPGPYFRRGIFRHSIREYKEAIEDYTGAIEHDVKKEYMASSFYNRGLAKFALKDREGAVKDWEEVKCRAEELRNPRVVGLAIKQLRAVGESG